MDDHCAPRGTISGTTSSSASISHRAGGLRLRGRRGRGRRVLFLARPDVERSFLHLAVRADVRNVEYVGFFLREGLGVEGKFRFLGLLRRFTCQDEQLIGGNVKTSPRLGDAQQLFQPTGMLLLPVPRAMPGLPGARAWCQGQSSAWGCPSLAWGCPASAWGLSGVGVGLSGVGVGAVRRRCGAIRRRRGAVRRRRGNPRCRRRAVRCPA